MSFTKYLKRRDPVMFKEMDDLGLNTSDPKQMKAMVAAMQKQGKVDMKKVAADVNANPDAKPDKAKMAADKQFQTQQDMLAGKAVPTGIKPSDWEKSVGLLTPTGNPVPNQIGKGPPRNVAQTRQKGATQGALPANVHDFTPPGLKMNRVKPPVNATSPDVDPNAKPMSPSEMAKAKAKPEIKLAGR